MIQTLRWLLFAALVSFLVVSGCAKSSLPPTAPSLSSSPQGGEATLSSPEQDCLRQSRGWANFFPLDSGSVWRYEKRFLFVLRYPSDPPDTFYASGIETGRMLGTRYLSGRAYAVEDYVEVDSSQYGYESYHGVAYYRQDATGLYEAMLVDGTPPADGRRLLLRAFRQRLANAANRRSLAQREGLTSAFEALQSRLAERETSGLRPHRREPGSGSPDELVLLRYPLRPGARWLMTLGLEYVVERPEILRLDREPLLAWRIRVLLLDPAVGEAFTGFAWWGRDGQLGDVLHDEAPLVDANGHVYGTGVADESHRLVSIHLAGRGDPR